MQGEYDARKDEGFWAVASASPLQYTTGYAWIKIYNFIRDTTYPVRRIFAREKPFNLENLH